MDHGQYFPIEILNQSDKPYQTIIERLTGLGYQTFIVGGAVRDAIRVVEPKDIDLVTSAPVEITQSLFEEVLAIGAHFGILKIRIDNQWLEVAQFRQESDYTDGRHPRLVTWATPEQDAHRRDFTMNGLFYDPQKSILYDYVGGLADIKAKTIRAIGLPKVRFKEDALRILRLIRFATELDFQIETSTLQAALDSKLGLIQISQERILDELIKMAKAPYFIKYTNHPLLTYAFESMAKQKVVNINLDPNFWLKEHDQASFNANANANSNPNPVPSAFNIISDSGGSAILSDPKIQFFYQLREQEPLLVWCYWALHSSNLNQDILKYFLNWPLSKDKKKQISIFIEAFDEDRLNQLSLGELLEKAFNKTFQLGLSASEFSFKSEQIGASFNKQLDIINKGVMPQKNLIPTDAIKTEFNNLKDFKLGQLLKWIYLRQLEEFSEQGFNDQNQVINWYTQLKKSPDFLNFLTYLNDN